MSQMGFPGNSAGKENSPAMQETPVQFLGQEVPLEKADYPFQYSGLPWAQTVKNPPAKRETWVRSPGWEDTLEECMATHSSILAWRILLDRGAWWATAHGVVKSWT